MMYFLHELRELGLELGDEGLPRCDNDGDNTISNNDNNIISISVINNGNNNNNNNNHDTNNHNDHNANKCGLHRRELCVRVVEGLSGLPERLALRLDLLLLLLLLLLSLLFIIIIISSSSSSISLLHVILI